MLYLIFDAATSSNICALVEDKKILCQARLKKKDTHLMILQLEKLLKKGNYTLKDLHAVSVGIGPGSYTGIRMASVIAEGLAYSCNLPVVTFSSLHLFSSNKKGPFYSVLSAYLSGVYCVKGLKEKDQITFERPLLLSLEQLKELDNKQYSFITPDYEILSNRASFISWEKRSPKLDNAVHISYHQIISQKFTSLPVMPLYLRSP